MKSKLKKSSNEKRRLAKIKKEIQITFNEQKQTIKDILIFYWGLDSKKKLPRYLTAYLAREGVEWKAIRDFLIDIAGTTDGNKGISNIANCRKIYDRVKRGENLRGKSGLREILLEPHFEIIEGIFEKFRIPAGKTVKEILSSKIDKNAFIVEKIAMKGAITLISGNPGIGKTWLSLEIAKSAVSGKAFLGRFKTRKAKVAYFDEENPLQTLKDRIRLLKFPTDKNSKFEIYHFKNLNVENDIRKLEKIARKKDLLIFDSLRQFHDRNENKSKDVKIVMNKFKKLARKCRCSIILIHHLRKPGQFQANDLHSVRGSTQIVHDVDMAFNLRKIQNNEIVMEATKSRVIREPSPIKFEIRPGLKKVELNFLGEHVESEFIMDRAKKLLPGILQDSQNSMSLEMIREELQKKGVGISEPSLRLIVRGLEKNDLIESEAKAHNKKYYYISAGKDADEELEEQEEEFMTATKNI